VIDLARAAAPAERERLMLALAKLCDLPEAGASERARTVIRDLFMSLVEGAERSIRMHLAEAIAPARWAPSSLINALALDDIDIARPVIAKSPVLEDDDLIRILVAATLEHQIEVARRPGIGERVVSEILQDGQPQVMAALASNETAEVSPAAMQGLVAASRQVAALRSPLARHPRLTDDLGKVLYTWVGDALQKELARRFTLDPEAMKAAMTAAVDAAYEGKPSSGLAIPAADPDRQEMETRLIAKLQAAGQLRPGFLLKSLRDEKLYLFELALASLAQMKTEQIRAIVASTRPELLALACAGVGIDRSVFPTILQLVRGLNEGRPAGGADSLRAVHTAFTHGSPAEALAELRLELAGGASALRQHA
jgi:uncharacterized protein (DUF2336 family)